MAPRADSFCAALARYIGDQLQIPIAFIDDIAWQERERRFDAGDIDICWICGLPYVWKADRGYPPLELLAAPVMSGARYQNRPVYFSDVVVRQTSPLHTFADLRGATWAYNEPASHSGYNVVRHHLATLAATSGYFGQVIESGAHQRSLQLLLAGQIDATAIDSTVLEAELWPQPEIAAQLRVIATLGPSSIPPWIIQRHLPQELGMALRSVFLDMHRNPQGRALLTTEWIARFVQVDDRVYDDIRRMDQRAADVTL
jgi:phosphonate transport system substrate-binding protein